MRKTTRTVSIREFRENMSKLLREAQKKNVHFVIMRHAEPVAHVAPASRKASLEAFARDIAIARREAREGKTYSTAEVRTLLGL